MKNPLALEPVLATIFDTKKVEYLRQSFQNKNYNYILSCKVITPEINGDFAEKFHNGSYFSISKAVKQDHLNVIVDITEDDLREVIEN